MEVLQAWFDNSQLPLLSAFILGLMIAISPCLLIKNITAIAFIGKDINNKRKVFINGLVYTLGRAITYTGIGLLFYFGASQFHISGFVQQWGEKILGPILIIVGVLMFDVIRINLPGFAKLNEKIEKTSKTGFLGVLLLGVVFSLSFCPYSGVLYFGILIPITITSASGLYLPLIFAIGTGLPVIIFAWLIAYTIGGISSIYTKVKIFEIWFRRFVSLIFILAGIYYLVISFL